MPYHIDPALAMVDFDAMSLTSYSLEPAPQVPTTVGMFSPGIAVDVNLEGGLGRMRGAAPNGDDLFAENVELLTASGLFVNLTGSDREELNMMLGRWRDMNVPLRFLDFGTQAMLMEDESHFVILPSGPRNVRLS